MKYSGSTSTSTLAPQNARKLMCFGAAEGRSAAGPKWKGVKGRVESGTVCRGDARPTGQKKAPDSSSGASRSKIYCRRLLACARHGRFRRRGLIAVTEAHPAVQHLVPGLLAPRDFAVRVGV